MFGTKRNNLVKQSIVLLIILVIVIPLIRYFTPYKIFTASIYTTEDYETAFLFILFSDRTLEIYKGMRVEKWEAMEDLLVSFTQPQKFDLVLSKNDYDLLLKKLNQAYLYEIHEPVVTYGNSVICEVMYKNEIQAENWFYSGDYLYKFFDMLISHSSFSSIPVDLPIFVDDIIYGFRPSLYRPYKINSQ